MEMLIKPKKSFDKGLVGSTDLAKLTCQLVRDAASLALMSDDSRTRLKGTPGSAIRVTWCQPIQPDEVKTVGRTLKCAVNDVLLSCVTGAIGQYLEL